MIAVLSVSAGFFLGGKYLAFLQREKNLILEDALLMLNSVQNRLRYSYAPLAEIMKSLAQSGCGSLTAFAELCSTLLESGEAFPQAWSEGLSRKKEICRLFGNQKENFLMLGKTLGTTDIEGQLSCCEYYKTVFEAEAKKRRETSERYSGVFPHLGALLGFAAAIFMI